MEEMIGYMEEMLSFPRGQMPSDYFKCFKHEQGFLPVPQVNNAKALTGRTFVVAGN